MNVLFLVLSFLSTQAFAGEIKLKSLTEARIANYATTTQYFEVNEELGRAWVKIEVSHDENSEEERVLVPGLSFDKISQSVVLDFEGKLTTCAEFVSKGTSIFRQKSLVPTSSCRFVARTRRIQVDDGFEIKTSTRYEIFLVVE